MAASLAGSRRPEEVGEWRLDEFVASLTGSSANTIAEYDHASIADPGSYRIQMRIAGIGAERGRCDLVKRHAMRAHTLFPAAPEPAHLLAGCGVRLKRR